MTLIFCLLLTNGFSQVWIDSNAKWTFDYFNVAESGTWRFEYTHDTLIQGHQSQLIKSTKYRYFGPGTSIINSDNIYTYSSNDSVFYFKDDKFFLLYDFGAQIGDTWVVAIDTTFDACQDTAIVQVVDTGSITINGLEHRTITLETISASLYALNGLCVERFGIHPTTYEHCNFGFLPGYQYCEGGPIFDYDLLTFRCYEDAGFPAYNATNKDCDTLTSSKELASEGLKIYPNPAKSVLNIDFPANYDVLHSKIEIINTNGQIILPSKPFSHSTQLDIKSLAPGLYIVKIQNNETLIRRRLIIQ
ncbi:MAG: T9SS type A sorting domain-containing protein [Bacteroidales bacterium]|nr:T9SS type A sorting domain-containing protein [Bacteroidales bacterium]